MQLTSRNFTALLQTLSLTQGLLKPSPLLSGLSIDGKNSISGSTLAGLVSSSATFTGDSSGAQAHSVDKPHIASNSDPGDNDEDDIDGASDPCAWEPYDLPPLGPQSFLPFDKDKANVYRYRQQQSVNLGSWYVFDLSARCILILSLGYSQVCPRGLDDTFALHLCLRQPTFGSRHRSWLAIRRGSSRCTGTTLGHLHH